jgi:hypothetical protein
VKGHLAILSVQSTEDMFCKIREKANRGIIDDDESKRRAVPESG